MAVPRIHRLEEEVVNRIAAGEVIHRPANALKELLENSLDAKSTKIAVILRSGGLKSLQVQDDGCGIRKEDFPILCERYTTSKLTTFEDLMSINTFGFRGEALASLTHIAHVTVTSMTADAPCAYRASFSDGKLLPNESGAKEPQQCAGIKGTIIYAEDLFYNVPIRLAALKNHLDEYTRCLDVISRFAVHYAGVGFSCKKQGDAKTDVQTLPSATREENIGNLFGSSIVPELLSFGAEDPVLQVKTSGLVTSASFHLKKLILILFINNRLVECTALKRVIEGVYANLLPRHTHPFVYMSVQLAPENLDVNVHPTKNEVAFLFEEQIAAFVEAQLQKTLESANKSRNFLTQSLLPGATAPPPSPEKSARPFVLNSRKRTATGDPPPATTQEEEKVEDSSTAAAAAPARQWDKPKYQPNKLVRTDAANPQGRLEAYLQHPKQRSLGTQKPQQRAPVLLRSVEELLEEVEARAHPGLTELFKDHVWVGSVNEDYCMLQHKTTLHLVHVPTVTRMFFHEQVLRLFGNMPRMNLSGGLELRELLALAADDDQALAAAQTLKYKAAMLLEYFSIAIDEEGFLQALPELVENYSPPMLMLPTFLLRLALEVDYTREKECFQGVAEELARFYQVQPGRYLAQQTLSAGEEPSLTWLTQHKIFPCLRQDFHPTGALNANGGVTQVASLDNLYKIFERC